MSNIVEGSKGDISAWSGELLEEPCKKCDEEYLEIVKFQKTVRVGDKKQTVEHHGLMCIVPSCSTEYHFEELQDFSDVEFINISSDKRNFIRERRKQIYTFADDATEMRHRFSNVVYGDIDEQQAFAKYWSASPEQVLRSSGVIGIGAFIFVSFFWLIILGISLVVNLLVDWSFTEGVVGAAGPGFLYIGIFAVIAGLVAGYFVMRQDQFNGVEVNATRIRLKGDMIDPNQVTAPYIIPEDSSIKLINAVGEVQKHLVPEDLNLTQDEFSQFLAALNGNNFLYQINDDDEDPENSENISTIQDEMDDEEFFYQVFTEKMKMELMATLNYIERMQQMAVKQQQGQDPMGEMMSHSPSSVDPMKVDQEAPSSQTETLSIDFDEDQSTGQLTLVTKVAALDNQNFFFEHTQDNFAMKLEKSADSEQFQAGMASALDAVEPLKFSTPENLDLGRKIRIRITFENYAITNVTFNGRQLDPID